MSKILDTNRLQDFIPLFDVAGLGKNSIDIILINTVIPYKYAYALHRNNSEQAEQVLELMHHIPAEDNTIIRKWRVLGQQVGDAADSQALLHLFQNYCQHHECLNCEVGYAVFQRRQLRLF